jgi:hypothetical protein
MHFLQQRVVEGGTEVGEWKRVDHVHKRMCDETDD